MKNAIKTVLAISLALVIAFPLFYMASTSFFSPADFRAGVSKFFPSTFSLDNYELAMGQRYFSSYLMNSIATSLITAAGRTLIVIFAAFAFTHLEFKAKKAIFVLLVSTLFIPQDALLYQNYSTISKLGLLNTWAGIVLPALFSATQLILLVSLKKDYF